MNTTRWLGRSTVGLVVALVGYHTVVNHDPLRGAAQAMIAFLIFLVISGLVSVSWTVFGRRRKK